MTGLPPARYRVFEQERRLVVIDTWADGGRPPAGAPTPSNAPSPSVFARARQVRFDDGAVLTTHPWYDLKAPRMLRLAGAGAALAGAGRSAGLVIAAVVIAAVVFTPWIVIPVLWVGWSARDRLRGAVTRWLDRADSANAY